MDLSVSGRDVQLPKPSKKLISSSCIGAECHISLDDLRIVPLLCLVIEEPISSVSKCATCQSGSIARLTDLWSPLEGRPMTSRGSTLAGFNRLHGPDVARPPRADIEEIRGSRGGGWESWKACRRMQEHVKIRSRSSPSLRQCEPLPRPRPPNLIHFPQHFLKSRKTADRTFLFVCFRL